MTATQQLLEFFHWCEEQGIRLTLTQKEMAARLLQSQPFNGVGRGGGKTFLLMALDRFITEKGTEETE